MNASEKLKMLQSFTNPNHGPTPMWVADATLAALPQLVAVVEAAEKMHHEYQMDMNDWSYAEGDGSVNEVDPDFVAALAALDEALT